MTEDSDFKRLVRERAAKTGESYQAARRQVERQRDRFAATIKTRHVTKDGLVALGCIMEAGRVARGMTVTVTSEDGAQLRGAVVSLRHMWDDLESVAHGEWGEFGLVLDPNSTNYIWRFFCRITDPIVAAVALVTPKAAAPVVVWLFGVVWLFWLRVLLLYGFLVMGALPKAG